MSDVVINYLQEFFKKFARDGVVKYPNENVVLLVHHINAGAERLAEVSSILRDTPLLRIPGFTKYSVPDFVSPFGLVLNIKRVI